MKLYGFALSSATQRVLVTAYELGLDLPYTSVDLFKGEHKAKEYIDTKHPFGMVPSLELDDGTMIYESRAIVAYLARTNGGVEKGFIPGADDSLAMAKYDQAFSTEAANYEHWLRPIIVERVFHPMMGRKTNEEMVSSFSDQGRQALEGYERILSKQRYIMGDTLSIVDLSYLPYAHLLRVAGVGHLVDEHAHVKAWLDDLQARPSWQRCLKGFPI